MCSKKLPRNIPVSAKPRSFLVPENAKTPTQRRNKMKRFLTLPRVKKNLSLGCSAHLQGRSKWERCWMWEGGEAGGEAQECRY